MSLQKYSEERPWGKFERFTKEESSTVKLLTLEGGGQLSLQYHRDRDEFWKILSGSPKVEVGEEVTNAKPGDEFFIPRGTSHRITAGRKVSVLEIAFGAFNEADITRLQDKYHRDESAAYHYLAATLYSGHIALLARKEHMGTEELVWRTSRDGIHFAKEELSVELLQQNGKKADLKKLSGFHVSAVENHYYLTCTESSRDGIRLLVAVSDDLMHWKARGHVPGLSAGVVVPHFRLDGELIIFGGSEVLRTAHSRDGKTWHRTREPAFAPHSRDRKINIRIIGVDVGTDGIMVYYDASERGNSHIEVKIGSAVFSKSNPNHLHSHTLLPLWIEKGKDVSLSPVGAAFMRNRALLFWSDPTHHLRTVVMPHTHSDRDSLTVGDTKLAKHHKNPIIEPHPGHEWERDATFNPAVLYEGGKVHILYRSIGPAGISSLGYASSRDGFTIDERIPEPVYYPREHFEGVHGAPSSGGWSGLYASGGGWGGCEDPKLTLIEEDKRVYLTYVAYDGWHPPRIALSSISKDDFLNKRFVWERPVLISPPGIVDKSGAILSEKINGKYVIFHRVFPDILVDYVDGLSFGEGTWLKGEHKIPTRPLMWDSRKVSIGAPPIKTDEGWLAIYHAIDDKDSGRYKVGAMLLDRDDPKRVIARTSRPILVPDERYENEGKAGVAYPCGAAVVGENLLVYYGGGDRVVCVASAPLHDFVERIKSDRDVSLQPERAVFER